MACKKIILPFFLLLCQFIFAQNDTIVQLQEVIVSDMQLLEFSGTQSTQQLNDSLPGRNGTSLTSLLQYNTVIYFKENGLGMVASPSFRGTTAQQTAVIWNGININSQLNGQTDFNIINARDFNSVTVRAGGGSVIYGSSAIGGSIHLDNDLTFGDKFDNSLRIDYGSFNTFGANYNLKASGEKLSTGLSVSRNSSDNDYDYPGWDMKNENGQYHNTSLNAAFAYQLNDRNILKLYSYVYDGERHFSGTLGTPSKSKYYDTNTRNLLEWAGYYNRFTSKIKVAYLQEEYRYYENHQNSNYTFGKVKTFIGKYDLAYDISEKIKFNTIIDYTQNNGEGSDILSEKRGIGSGSLLMKHQVSQKFHYELGIRKEITNAYESPLLFSAGTAIKAAAFYTIKVNTSRNFRIPTFNDLYWQGTGNPNLKHENSYQAELGNVLHFGNLTFTLTGYYIKLQDMLRWVPSAGGIWRPENVDKVNTYGLESILNWKKKIGGGQLEFNGTYAYTVSREDGKTEQLIYVPLHKATASLAYAYKGFSGYYRHVFNGEVFTSTDNAYNLDAYNVSGIGAEYNFKVLSGIALGVQANNLWNEEYQNVIMRPMPGRYYNMYLNFKF
ncbi:TonB-dependent receptor [Flavobacterium sp. MFBS3-15]|uniref:TonB-dependent receptor plug domain-containing protein n=1 Tax=Flavobacterium sp. MFBS3-15 TaxID=2989816 RepID=UPI0022356B77|nr:TonB-dependent receptor [Flavobacterium sp. MFBS3-15]MCW4467538.1 TonB-dependent receptor [Flavobacterium sp. MFBS3-15]